MSVSVEKHAILMSLQPLMEEAEGKGLWFFHESGEAGEIWCSPEYLRLKQAQGEYVWARRLFYSIASRLPAATGLSNKVPLRIAVEKYMRGVNRNPVLDTDFFWYRKPSLPSGVVFGYFAQPGDQPTLDRQVLMKEAGSSTSQGAV